MIEISMYTAFFAGLGIYSLYLMTRCYYQVEEGHVAVLSSFGKAEFIDSSEQQLRTHKPGFRFKRPWQKVHKVSLMERMIDLSGQEGGTSAMASDGTMLRLDSKLRFTPRADDLYLYLFSLENPIEHVKGLFTCLLRNEIANFDSLEKDSATEGQKLSYMPGVQVGSYASIRRERRLLNQHIQEFCRLQIGERYGVVFNGVDLTDILPPDELAHALNGVMNAQSEAKRVLAQTEGECEQRILAARKGLTISRHRAKAAEDEIGTMAQILNELQKNGTLRSYVERRRTEVFSEARMSYIKRSQ